jgi:D-alanyl-D-alanine carboxypeptidase
MITPTPARMLIATAAAVSVVLAGPAASVAAAPRHPAVQDSLDRAVTQAGAPGMVAEIRDRHGTWFGSAGVADTTTGRPRRPGERFRIGSASKAFTATVVLQLVAEHRLSLDDTVDRWLPGLVRGNGYDGRRITIRQLLNHTSGMFNYGSDDAFTANGKGDAFFAHRFDRYAPVELVEVGLRNPPYFAPGGGFGYSNTDYILAGMIVEKATGRTLADELTRRISRPLGLTGTYLPGDEPGIRGPHPVHYSILFSQDPHPAVYDATEMNQSFAWAAGGVVSTAGDLNRFFSALLAGRLLPAAEQREMFSTVATVGGPAWIPDTRYGLGVFSQTLPCGVTVWGNAGATYGSFVYAMGSRDGKHMLASEVNGDWSGLGVFNDLLSAEFCPANPR